MTGTVRLHRVLKAPAERVYRAFTTPEAMAKWLPGGEMYVKWARTLFFVPAIAGGVFGLLGGYLTDLLGRRRVLTFSILLYAGAACAAGFAQTLPQLLFFRCLVFIGVCVEFVAAVAWLAELFTEAKRRGLNPNQWFFQVERIAMEQVGMGGVSYVNSVNKYYLAFDRERESLEPVAAKIASRK